MADETDFYAILGVPKTANEKEIRVAYRKLAVLYHPDKNPSKEAHDKFVAINEAYSVLNDADQRKIYDRYGRNGLQNGGKMTPEQAVQQFWEFFRPSGYERGANASARHGAYVASYGGVTAPLKGAAVGTTVATAGIAYGGLLAGAGVVGGFQDVRKGVQRIRTRAPKDPEEPSAARYFAGGLVKPVTGVIGGAAVMTGAAVGGVALGLAGGVGGAWTNIRDGSKEVYDAAANRKSTKQNPPLTSAPGQSNVKQTLLLLEDAPLAEKGRLLYSKSLNGELFFEEAQV